MDKCKWLGVKKFTGTAQCLEKRVTRQRLRNTVVAKLDTFSTSVMNRAPQILLPTKPNRRSKPTQLQKTAIFTSPSHEHIFPFLLPQWRKTQLDYGERFTIHQFTAHCHPKIPYFLTYSDGSQISFLNCFRQVRSAAVGYHLGREVFHWKLDFGGSVYDAELTELVAGLSESISFVNHHPKVHYIHLYTDNVSVISTVSNSRPQWGQLIAYILNALSWLDSLPHHHLFIS